MSIIKKITSVQNSTLIIHGLDALNYKEVEVIITPVSDKKSGVNTESKFSARRK